MIFAIVLQPLFQCGLLGKNGVYFIVQVLDHDLGLQVDFIVIFRSAAVFFLLTVLAHHDQRCLNRRHTGQYQIQQNKRIRVKCLGSLTITLLQLRKVP